MKLFEEDYLPAIKHMYLCGWCRDANTSNDSRVCDACWFRKYPNDKEELKDIKR